MSDSESPREFEGIPLDEYAQTRDEARFRENQHLRRKLRSARSTAREAQAELQEVKERLQLYEQLEAAKLEPPAWLSPDSPDDHAAIPCLALGDIHWGERVRPEQIGGVNAYNLEIAEQRLHRAFDKTITICRDYLAGLSWDGLQVFLTGDMISGRIHDDLRETNESTLTESIVSLVEPLSAGLELLSEEFGRVHVAAVVGNHGRLTKKTLLKSPHENADWLVYQMLTRDFTDREDVTIDVAHGFDMRVTVYNTKFFLTHGAQFRGGTGISGIASPLALGVHRATRRTAEAGKPFDEMVLGHFHQAMRWPAKGIIVSGTPKGYDEYAASKNLEPEEPQHSLWLTTPERGVTHWTPVYVMDREEEGW